MSQIRDKKGRKKGIETKNPINAKSVQLIELHAFACDLVCIYYRNHLTSSKLDVIDYQQLTEALVQIRNAINILNVINQQISISIRVMLFLFFLVLLYIPFVCAKVQLFLQTS